MKTIGSILLFGLSIAYCIYYYYPAFGCSGDVIRGVFRVVCL